MGTLGGALAIVSVVACPITSGDTAFRSARLTLADWFNLDQSTIRKRVLLTIPLLAVGAVLTQLNFDVIWRYFSWANQTLAMIALWAATVYLYRERKDFACLVTAVPALFMTAVSSTYILVASEGFHLPLAWGYPLGLIFTLLCFILFSAMSALRQATQINNHIPSLMLKIRKQRRLFLRFLMVCLTFLFWDDQSSNSIKLDKRFLIFARDFLTKQKNELFSNSSS